MLYFFLGHKNSYKCYCLHFTFSNAKALYLEPTMKCPVRIWTPISINIYLRFNRRIFGAGLFDRLVVVMALSKWNITIFVLSYVRFFCPNFKISFTLHNG